MWRKSSPRPDPRLWNDRSTNYVREGLEESLATIEKLNKPVIASKVLGAGRILPKDTLPYVFQRLKPKDGVCIGVFPRKRDEPAENASLARQLLMGERRAG